VKRISVAIVDYNVGNHLSVSHTLTSLGYICTITANKREIEKHDIVLLPGVGAFPSAMQSLRDLDLVNFLRGWGREGRPLLGICLGMQLLAERSFEGGETEGLGLLAGSVMGLAPHPAWHIGWNTLQRVNAESMFKDFEGEFFYFNHSYAFGEDCGAAGGFSYSQRHFPAIVRHGQIVGLQFHPEKSQDTGKRLLQSVIRGLYHG